MAGTTDPARTGNAAAPDENLIRSCAIVAERYTRWLLGESSETEQQASCSHNSQTSTTASNSLSSLRADQRGISHMPSVAFSCSICRRSTIRTAPSRSRAATFQTSIQTREQRRSSATGRTRKLRQESTDVYPSSSIVVMSRLVQRGRSDTLECSIWPMTRGLSGPERSWKTTDTIR